MTNTDIMNNQIAEIKLMQLRDIAFEYLPTARERMLADAKFINHTGYRYWVRLYSVATQQATMNMSASELVSMRLLQEISSYCMELSTGFVPTVDGNSDLSEEDKNLYMSISPQELHDSSLERIITAIDNFSDITGKDMKAFNIPSLKTTNFSPENTNEIAVIDITKHNFDVALSFAGENREYVKNVADHLNNIIGSHSYFYDANYVAQLARPSLDNLLQDIYRNRSKLVVVFLCGDYEEKEWCGIEFRAIKEIIMEKQHEKIMFVKIGDGEVQGVFKTDGYIDGMQFNPVEVANFIKERVILLKD